MAQHRNFQMVGGGNMPPAPGDTTYTKIFVGGLAWETQKETMKRYFEQFGEIQEAVVITDKYTGKSKGYGFVTFKDPESAMRACQDPSPVIDGRRANCNLASLGHRSNPSIPQQGTGRFSAVQGSVPAAAYRGTSPTYFQQPPQYPFPYSAYGYSGFSHENMYHPMSYYSVYGGNQVSPYYAAAGPGMFQGYYPCYSQYGHGQTSAQTQGFGVQYPQMVQYPYMPQQFGAGLLSLPASAATSTGVTVAARSSSSQSGPLNTTEQNSSA